MACSESPFLALPQEVRDLIYFFAFDERLAPPAGFHEILDDHNTSQSTAPSVFGIDAGVQRFLTNYPSKPPQPTWHSLLLCCRQTHQDVQDYFESKGKKPGGQEEAVLDVNLTSTSATTTWIRLPTPTPKDLRVNLRLTHMFDTNILAQYPSNSNNRALQVIFQLLKRYLTHGPHLSRPYRLSTPLKVDRVIIDIAPAFDFEDMQFYFGNPREQLKLVVEILMGWVEAFARSGALYGRVGEIVCGSGCLVEDGVNSKEFKVERDVWDEEVVVGFEGLGYRW